MYARAAFLSTRQVKALTNQQMDERSLMRNHNAHRELLEDGEKCDIILSSDLNAAEGISHVDTESRNYCWMKYKKGLIDFWYLLY